jgi:3-oxoacyl-[acyl-carrier-protein] synthase II
MSAASPHRPRVVVTGIGAVSPLGIGAEEIWASARAGRSCAAPITGFDPERLETRFACEVQGFEPGDFMDRRTARRMDRFAQMAVAAGRLALDDASIAVDEGNREAIGAIIGSGIGGLDSFTNQVGVQIERGPDRISPFFIPLVTTNMAAAHVSMQTGIQGPLSCVSTACATGNHAIGDALMSIRGGMAEVMLAGGTEAGVTELGIGAFNAMRALSTRNDDPEAGSRPFDLGRDGFVMGEAAAVIVLEERERALARGARIYCEVTGFGMTADAHHMTEPDPTGRQVARAMSMAIADSGVAVDEVDYVNAHATSTPAGDGKEITAIKLALGEERAREVAVSSTKSMHGHCLGATGGLEGALTALSIRDGVVPPTINLTDLDPECAGVDHVIGGPRELEIGTALSNGFGFGGHNAVVAMSAHGDA